MSYNNNYLINNELWQLRPKRKAINTYITKDKVIIAMFQGSKGQMPEIDFLIRVMKDGENERPFSPPHIFWVVDLMLKVVNFRKEVREILMFYLNFYENLIPFANPNEREDYKLATVNIIIEKYSYLENDNSLSLEYVSTIIELFCLNEKRNIGAYMFKNLLITLLNYTNGEADYIQVLQASQPGFR